MSQSNYKKQYVVLQNTVLVILETAFSFLLRHDPVLQLKTQDLIEQNALIKINSYIPFFDVYIQFTQRGVLFDITPPQRPADVEFRTTLAELIKVLWFGHLRSLKAMKATGNQEIQHQFQDLLLLCTLPKIAKEFPRWFQQKNTGEDVTASDQRVAPLLEQLEYQRQQIAKLKLEVKEQKYAKKNAYKREKLWKWSSIFFGLAWLITFVILIWIQW